MAGTDAKLTNPVFELTVALDNRINPCSLVDTQSGYPYADTAYRYTLTIKGQEEAHGLTSTGHQKETLADGSERLTLIGLIAGLRVEHVFEASPDPSFLQETIVFTNGTEENIEIENLSFGFRKSLAALPGDFHLVAVPYRIQVDGKVHDYTQEDLVNHRIQNSDWAPPWLDAQKLWNNEAGRSEGWILTDERRGLLVIKYSQDMMDYSIAGVEEQHLFFGGVGLCLYGEPSALRTLKPGQRIGSGTTRYLFIEGGWREGYRHFKTFMNGKGHRFPEQFNPPVHWNELFDVGWYHSDREELFKYYTREALFYECQKAAELGCEQLYLDPGWEICEGTTLWDEERLGKVEAFVTEVKNRFGLTVAFRTIGRVYRNELPVDWYIQKTKKTEAYTPYSEVYAGRTRIIWEVCTAHQPWREEKLRRLLNIMQGGVQFVLFDEF